MIGNRYRLLTPLGRGGTGIVYKAEDRLTGELVALKQMRLSAGNLLQNAPEDSEAAALALAFEFRTLASLHHPNIVTVLDYGFDKERHPFFTMKIIEDARPITEYGTGLDKSGKVRLLIEMLQALAYLHRRGIIHRDIKPSNVVIDKNGGVKVMDFGFALLHSQVEQARKEGLAGTLAYMAPELLQEDSPSIQSDLFAAGIIAYELFTGRYPFENHDSPTLLYSILQAMPDMSPLPTPLAEALHRFLAKQVKERYSNAQAAIEAICAANNHPLPVESISVRESYLQASAFIGRETELATLEAALDQIMQKPPIGGAWLIGGESGVGKSRLVDEMRVRAMTQGVMVLRGQEIAENGLLYHLWREPLRRLVLSTEINDTDAAILKEIIPDIDLLIDRPVADAVALQRSESQQRLISTIASLFQRQEHPTVLLLEDIHWSAESLEPLKPLISLSSNLPLLIIATYRDDEGQHVADLFPQTQILHLQRLDEPEIEALSSSMLGDIGKMPPLVSLIKRETEGNAFFIIEVVRYLAEEAGRLDNIGLTTLPSHVFANGMRAVVQRRLERVPEWGQNLLKLAAVAGRQIDRKLLQQIAGSLDAWLQACTDAAVLELRDGEWRFSHDKLREAVIQSLPADERAQLHLKVAQAIEHLYPNDDSRSIVLMQHWREAREQAQEIRYAHRAIEQLLAASSFMEAKSVAERVLKHNLPPENRAILLCYLGEALFSLSQSPQAREAFTQSLALATEPATIIRSRYNLGRAVARMGDYSEALTHYQASLSLARVYQHHGAVALNLESLGDLCARQGDYNAAQQYYEQSLTISREIGSKRGIAGNLSGLGWAASGRSDFSTASNYYQQSVAIAREIGDRRSIAGSLGNLGAVLMAQAEYATAREYYHQALALHREIGNKSGVAWTLWAIARVHFLQGNYNDAREYAIQSLAIDQEIGDKPFIASNIRLLGQITFVHGDYLSAQQYYENSLALVTSINHRLGIVLSLMYLGQTATAQGDYKAARSYFEKSSSVAEEMNFKEGKADILHHFGWIAFLQGEIVTANDYYQRSLSLAQEMNYRLGIATNLIHLGFVYLHTHDLPAALNNFMEALKIAYSAGLQPLILEALIGIAHYYFVQGTAERGIEPLRLVHQSSSLPALIFKTRLTPLLKTWKPDLNIPSTQTLSTIIDAILGSSARTSS